MCNLDPKPPELLIEQFQTVTVSSGQQVVLNCTVSSSPDLMYNWSIPYTCSSCPHNNNDSVMIFTADITDNGEYVCKAKNRYGATQITFTVEVLGISFIQAACKCLKLLEMIKSSTFSLFSVHVHRKAF